MAVIATSSLDPSNYNPPERLINVGLFPQDVAVTPDGKQVWLAETGPQTSPSSPSGVSGSARSTGAFVTVLDTATDSTVGSINLGGSTPQSGDGYEPTGIALTSTPTAGS